MRYLAALLMFVAMGASAEVRESTAFDVYRGSSIVERPSTLEACRARAAALEEERPASAHRCQASYRVEKVTAPAQPPTPPVEAWTKCANENERCAFEGTRTVRYGAGSTWISQQHNGGVVCANRTFGDPVPGTVKTCEFSGTAPSQPPEPPAAGSAVLTWPAVSNQDNTGLMVERATSADGEWRAVDTLSPSATTYTVTGLPSGTHYFRVVGVADAVRASPSPVASKTIP